MLFSCVRLIFRFVRICCCRKENASVKLQIRGSCGCGEEWQRTDEIEGMVYAREWQKRIWNSKPICCDEQK